LSGKRELMTDNRTPIDSTSSADDRLLRAIVRLEQLSSDCFEVILEHLPARGLIDIDLDTLHEEVLEKIAVGLGSALSEYCRNEPVPVLFVAPNYRQLTGSLRPHSATNGTQRTANHAMAATYVDRYGRLVGTSNPDINAVFLPVAYWMRLLYERQLEELGPSRSVYHLLGFSGWMERCGRLTRDGTPVIAIHFCLANDGGDEGGAQALEASPEAEDRSRQVGVLDVHFPPSTTHRSIIDEFRRQLEVAKCRFVPWGQSGRIPARDSRCSSPTPELGLPPLPLITDATGKVGSDVPDEVKNAGTHLFASLFYSNFRDPCSDDGWESATSRAAFILRITDPDRDTEAQLPDDYLKLVRATECLTFEHLYTLLLNPGVSLDPRTERRAAALGTFNLHADRPIAHEFLAVVRTCVESIYGMLRGIEEWEEALAAGRAEIAETFAHEIKDLPVNLENLITKLHWPASRGAPPQLFTVTRNAEACDSSAFGTLVLNDACPDRIATNLGVCFHVDAAWDIASLIRLWCQADDHYDMAEWLGLNGAITLSELVDRVWGRSARLLILASPFAGNFSRRAASAVVWAEEQFRDLDEATANIARCGLYVRLGGALADADLGQLFPPYKQPWFCRLLLAILRDYARFSPLGRPVIATAEAPSADTWKLLIGPGDEERPSALRSRDMENLSRFRKEAQRRNVSREGGTLAVVRRCMKCLNTSDKPTVNRRPTMGKDDLGCVGWELEFELPSESDYRRTR